MLNVQYGHDQMLRVDKKVKVTVPETEVPEGAVVKLDAAGEIVLTGTDASAEDFTWFAFNGANIADDVNSAHKATGNITLIIGNFIAETDQYVTTDTYNVGDDLVSENGVLTSASAAGDFAVGKVTKAPVSGILEFYAYSSPRKI